MTPISRVYFYIRIQIIVSKFQLLKIKNFGDLQIEGLAEKKISRWHKYIWAVNKV